MTNETSSHQQASKSKTTYLSSPQNVRLWLSKTHPKQLSLLNKFESELRLGQLSTSSTVTTRSSLYFKDPFSNDYSINRDKDSIYDNSGLAVRDRRLVTTRTVELLRSLIGSTRWKDAAQLMVLLRGLGQELHVVGGFRDPAIGNVVRRIMCAVRNEVEMVTSMEGCTSVVASGGIGVDGGMERIDTLTELMGNANVSGSSSSGLGCGGGLSLANMLWAHPHHVLLRNIRASSSSDRVMGHSSHNVSLSSIDSDNKLRQKISSNSLAIGGELDENMPFPPAFYVQRPLFRQAIMEALHEIVSDLEDLHNNIDDQATAHIHAGEIILAYARSKTVESFLKAAASKKRKFQVVVCEGSPHYGGHIMAKNLAKAGIETTVIHDAATFAIMARVNKVLLPAHAVLANGGLIAPSGSNMVAFAAAQNSVPVVSITGMFKLCPMYPHEGQDTLQDLLSPSSVINYAEMSNTTINDIEFINPVHDYIPPQLVNLYVTNIGAFQPSYIYRLLAEYYHIDDWESFE